MKDLRPYDVLCVLRDCAVIPPPHLERVAHSKNACRSLAEVDEPVMARRPQSCVRERDPLVVQSNAKPRVNIAIVVVQAGELFL